MIIEGSRIRNLQRHFGMVATGAPVVIGIALDDTDAAKRIAAGFAADPEVNTSILPARVGPISHYNAEGKHVPDRTRPMERVMRSQWRTWDDWHGNSHSDWVDIPYYRYPRISYPPPSVEIRVTVNTDGARLFVTDVINHAPNNRAAILHRVNLFLELFGRCEIFSENLERIIQAPVRRLNWQFLPRGQNPWAQVRPQLEPLIQRARTDLQPVIRGRLETINRHTPEFVAIGQGGFSGYVMFGFPARGLFLMESILFGNATYGFGQDWETVSRLSKAEVLNNNLHTHRIVHRDGWAAEIDALFP